MILVQENNDVSLLLNNSLPPHLQMLGTAPSFFWRQMRMVPSLVLVVMGMGREWAEQCNRNWSLDLGSEQTGRVLWRGSHQPSL